MLLHVLDKKPCELSVSALVSPLCSPNTDTDTNTDTGRDRVALIKASKLVHRVLVRFREVAKLLLQRQERGQQRVFVLVNLA